MAGHRLLVVVSTVIKPLLSVTMVPAWLAGCAGLCGFSRHTEAAARAPGLRQHHKLQQHREPAPVRVGRPHRRAVGLGGGEAGPADPHRTREQRAPRAVHAPLG